MADELITLRRVAALKGCAIQTARLWVLAGLLRPVGRSTVGRGGPALYSLRAVEAFTPPSRARAARGAVAS